MIGAQCFVGIDPGSSGAIAWIPPAGEPNAEPLARMTDRDVLDALRWVRGMWSDARAVLEEVHAMPRQGVSSTFKFGVNFGALRMALVAAEIPFDLVTPQRWQQALRCRSKGDKNVTKRRAQELFPSLRVTHATADALLLAEYARRSFAPAPAGALEAEASS